MTLISLLKAGENSWMYGILLKGFGICHGVYGSAYVMLSIYRLTGKEKWLDRALKLALVKLDPETMEEINSYKPDDRDVAGVPDFPYSLQCGKAGEICFLLDLLSEHKGYYPGYEIWMLYSLKSFPKKLVIRIVAHHNSISLISMKAFFQASGI